MIEKFKSVHWKLYRAKEHMDELARVLAGYYKSSPGEMVLDSGTFAFREKIPVPARIPLIVGDFLQNVRSALDYLVWELVIANGCIPGQHNAFPIDLTLASYQSSVTKRRRLEGIDNRAAAIIDAMQPYHCKNNAEKENAPLVILDRLTNINKHRRVLLATIGSNIAPVGDPPRFFINVDYTVKTGSGIIKEANKMVAFVTLSEGPIKGLEISGAIDALARFVIEETLPPFEKFFK
jgi:hypothetical protein